MIRQARISDNDTTVWVAHASAWWSIPRYEQDRNEVGKELETICLALLSEIEKKEVVVSAPTIGHRWGMSRCIQSINDKCIQDKEMNLIACGDGCGGVDIEACYLSGVHAANTIV
jgi:predicted NAD/FAD-dependent oxidoreductase